MPNIAGLLFGEEHGIVYSAMPQRWAHPSFAAKNSNFTITEVKFAMKTMLDAGLIEQRPDNGGEYRPIPVTPELVRAVAKIEVSAKDAKKIVQMCA